ncbi:hypothetical protein [Pseudarthrobacter phenanthrenivorans]|uniref:Uncharacterized protein n=1 Tax=Pseudarthrobacter phenanthrenivorans TaxID=361575 RepID=A0A0B4DIM1_PSEPS|nr:hypothetical protein [Pseudarthrobacter phenanthrenivorans]KIC68682.1 hypothetical protein RM50_04240 [Pseudarthrobacter phenanthrenivorans]
MNIVTEARVAQVVEQIEIVYTQSGTNWDYLWAAAEREQDAYGINRGAGDDEEGTYEKRQVWVDAHANLAEDIALAMEVFGIEAGGCRDYGVYSIGNEDIYADNEHSGIRSMRSILGQCEYAIREALEAAAAE